MKTVVTWLSVALFIAFYCPQGWFAERTADPPVLTIHLSGKAVVRVMFADDAKARLLSAYSASLLAGSSNLHVTSTIPEWTRCKDIVNEARGFHKGVLTIHDKI